MKNLVLMEMLKAYRCENIVEATTALREIMQNVALLALSRGNFFSHAAFYGGTALRILYGLNRGSEDMDFSLLAPDNAFDLQDYSDVIGTEFASFGMSASFSRRIKMERTNIQSGFLKGNTQTHLLCIGLDKELAVKVNPQSELKIKVEVDTMPPQGFQTEIKYIYQPLPFAVRSYTLPDLLSGKLHAVLFRSWKHRVKGRDWYDLAWYAAHHREYNLEHLEKRSRQSGDYAGDVSMTNEMVQEMLKKRLMAVDIEQLKDDVKPFLHDSRELDLWNICYFEDVFKRLRPSPVLK